GGVFAPRERAGVGELPDPLPRGDPERIVALRAHAAGALHLGPVDDLLAGVALDPQALGDDDLASARLLFALEPGHLDLPPRPVRRHGEGLAQRRLELGDELADVLDERRRAPAPLDQADDRPAHARPRG